MNDFLNYKDDPILFELAIRLNLLGIPNDKFELNKIENQYSVNIILPNDNLYASWKCSVPVDTFPERAVKLICDMLIYKMFKEDNNKIE